jgi:exopolysaccharide biosynthesis polyprenyl glycosylphosphotransferase
VSNSVAGKEWDGLPVVVESPSAPTWRAFENLSPFSPTRRLRRGALVRRVLLLADITGLLLAFVITGLAIPTPITGDAVRPPGELIAFFLGIPVWILLLKLQGLYDHDAERTDHSTVDDFVGVFQAITIGVWIFALIGAATHVVNPGFQRLALFWIVAILAITTLRSVSRIMCHRLPGYVQNAVIVGAGTVGQQIAMKILKHREYNIRVLGFVDDRPTDLRDDLADEMPVLLGSPDHLEDIVRTLEVDRVIVAFSNETHENVLDMIRTIREQDVQVDIVPRYFEVLGANTTLHTLEGFPLVGLVPLKLSRSSRLLKRGLDLIGAGLGLLVLWPLFVATAIAIKWETRGPVLFRQVRRGEGDTVFTIFKFRTMVADAEARKQDFSHLNLHRDEDPRMYKAPNDPRVTRVGAFLRRTSIDELPQLLNVLLGEMSLVGPRPLILDEDRHVERWARKRLSLRPGMTGLWQVTGRSDIPFEEMTKLDYLYVTNWSLTEDIRLIMLTLPSLVRSRRAF